MARTRNNKGKFVKADEVAADQSPAAVPVNDEDIVASLLGKFRAMEERQDALERENAELAQELDEARNRNAAEMAALAAKAVNDPLRPNALPPEADNSRLAGDRPGTLEEHLDAMERLARENGTQFDRDRTRKIMLGQPVEDANKFVYNGHAFDTEKEMEVYKAMVEREKVATIGKYPR